MKSPIYYFQLPILGIRNLELGILFILLFVGCGSGPIFGTHPTSQKDTILETSSPFKPIWLNKLPPEAGDCISFVGEETDIKKESAEEKAKLDMLKDYAIYLGANIEVLEKIHREEIKREQDEIYKTKGQVITEVQALVNIYSSGCRFIERYWEKWRKGEDYVYYKYWVLGEINKKFVNEERERLNEANQIDAVKESFANSDLSVEVKEDKGRYKAGDSVVIKFWANDNCYAYILNFYGEGKTEYLGQKYLENNTEYNLSAVAQYLGKAEEIIKVIVSDKLLDIDRALKELYPLAIVENIRNQADDLKAKYAEKSTTIFIVSK
jgi:hypothetical protein